MDSIIAKLTGEQALQVLHRLSAKNKKLSQAVTEEARQVLEQVDPDEVAAHVCYMLSLPDMDDLNHRSGRTRFGYVDPVDAIYDIFTQQLDPFMEQLAAYRSLSMAEKESTYLQGLILGLYRCEFESQGELSDWYTDLPADTAAELLHEWKKHHGFSEADAKMKDFLSARCPHWVNIL